MRDIKFEEKYGYLILNGTYYKFKSKDGKPSIVKADEKKIKKQLDMSNKIAKKLKDHLDVEAVLVENLMSISYKDVNILFNKLFKSKRKSTIKTREHHCVDMKIGNFILPIVN